VNLFDEQILRLPDAHADYAILDVGDTDWKLQTCTR
jgi:hypothetical protein